MYGHAVNIAALTKPITEAHHALIEKVKEMYSRDDHPDLHEMHHPSQIQMWLRTTRFKQLASSYTVENWEGDEELEKIMGILEEFALAA